MIPNVTRIRGTVLRDAPGGNDYIEVTVEGVFLFRTDDPSEHIQDIVIRTDAGETVYIDEQEARVVTHTVDGATGVFDTQTETAFAEVEAW